MISKLSIVLLILTIGHSVHAQVAVIGRCPKAKVMDEFDLEAYTGIWFEYARFPQFWEINNKCNYAKYTDLGNDTVGVYNSAFDITNDWPGIIEGYAKVLGPARLAVVFPNNDEENLRENYTVLGTDYKSWALVFSCQDLGGLFHTEFLWILTRDRIPSQETVDIAKNLMTENGISQDNLYYVIQENCPAPGKYN